MKILPIGTKVRILFGKYAGENGTIVKVTPQSNSSTYYIINVSGTEILLFDNEICAI